MEKITTHNYEAFYLDYLEGNLSETGLAELLDFLDRHPDLKFELNIDNDVLTYNLKPEKLVFSDVDSLKQIPCLDHDICMENVKDFMVAAVENQLDEKTLKQLNLFIVENKLEKELTYYNSTILKPNLTEVFDEKSSLKRKSRVIPLFIRISAAAAIGLLIFNWTDFGNNNQSYSTRLSKFKWEKPSNNFEPLKDKSKQHQSKTTLIANQKNDSKLPVKQNKKSNQNPLEKIASPEVNQVEINFVKNEPIVDSSSINQTPNLKNDFPDDEQLVTTNQNEHKNQIKLVDMYKPVTDFTNSHTNLDVTYKKSVPESEYQVTKISLGKFSFERKKRK
ncbi:MAG: hypothetical protein ACWA41_04190 [Putridiphycobacter sp.]